ncbi:unnamed protein product [Anisakis simplex]|uniref:Alanine--glyoxylate aminotransferase 2-like (inferred by orthology to a C. elegans protein) n=1 Tax=Anisakis simplex TaxID=6269 RepID=A0A0M3K6B4_ANISI|nr:unnamed protein product [Anisakis simplex]
MDIVVQALAYFNTTKKDTSKFDTLISPSAYKQQLLQKRKECIGSKCQMFYKDDPFVVSKASMQYIYDESGRKYIDCISNVQHVGHCHPKVVDAITTQLSLSTCNVRFVSAKLTECAEELLKTLPGLDTVLFCNSGSEANDLALRLARDYTQHQDVIVLDHAYHGHVTTTMQLSPYKFDHECTIKQPDWVHVVRVYIHFVFLLHVFRIAYRIQSPNSILKSKLNILAPCPDVYRGVHRLADEDLNNPSALSDMGDQYAMDVKNIINNMHENERQLAAYFAEALQSCGGQVLPPKGYFSTVAKYVRQAGGLIVIDEVQTGFGRVGNTFWAHKLNDEGDIFIEFIPDIITMGKPMGNGFPVSAVVTRKEIADTLGGKVGYFNTYGGNPVACAAALSVMNVIKEENLLEHSQVIGELFEKKLNQLKAKHQCIGDVRGVGLFWGIDLVRDRCSREPDSELALRVILKLRSQLGVLLSVDGPYSNILKIKPPLCFSKADLDYVSFISMIYADTFDIRCFP